jgi:uncharacterized protein YcfL
MKSKISFVAFAFFAILMGCKVTSKINVNLPPIQYEDFKTFSSPRTSYSPGYIFRVADNKQGELIYVTQLNPKTIVPSDEAIPQVTKNWKTSILLKFLGLNEISGSISNDKDAALALSFSTGKREQLSETDITNLLQTTKIDFKTGSKYYVVSETVAFSSIDYKLFNYDKLGVDVKAQIEKLEIQGKFTHQRNDSTTLVQSFKEPHRVFYKVLEFNDKGTMLKDTKEFEYKKAKDIYIME